MNRLIALPFVLIAIAPLCAQPAPSFEVSVIHPAAPDHGLSIHVNPSGLLTTTNSSLLDLIKYAWDLNPKQITGGPNHSEQNELPVYAITQSKGGAKMKEETDSPGALPNFSGAGLRGLTASNASMSDLASLFQTLVLDRPVVDQTGLANKRFNFVLRWMPSSLAEANKDVLDAPPDIFTAIQEQLGLRLEPARAPVQVMVIDKAERPGEN
jgi:hypothetical protein